MSLFPDLYCSQRLTYVLFLSCADQSGERSRVCWQPGIIHLQPRPSLFFPMKTNVSLEDGSAACAGVRFEPEDALDRGERTHSSIVRHIPLIRRNKYVIV